MPLVALGLGANLGECTKTLARAWHELTTQPRITPVALSQLYKSQPLGPPQPEYYNACGLIETEYTPEQLLVIIQKIEDQWGRTREIHWGPRTLDLDILLYGDAVIATPQLMIPHPWLLGRNFALIPLAKLAPEWIHPVAQESLAQLAERLDWTGLEELGPVR